MEWQKFRETLGKIGTSLNMLTFAAFVVVAGFLYYHKEYTASFWLLISISLKLILDKLEGWNS